MSRSLLFRIRAAGLHLLGSAVVIGLFLWLVYGYWYMHPYEIVFSTIDVVKVLIGVDLVLGPLLTLIVFNIAKPRKELVRDIGVILAFQLAALAWGAHITYSVRPQYVVYYDQDIYVLTAKDLDISRVSDEIGSRSFLSPPVVVYAQSPQTTEEITQHVADMFTRNMPDVPYQPERYRPYAQNRTRVAEAAIKPDDMRKKSDIAKIWVDSLFENTDAASIAFFKIESGVYSSYAAVSLENGFVLDVMPDQLAPPPENKS
jgi:hypothetical protein